MANTTITKTIVWGRGQNTLYAGTPLDNSGRIVNDGTAVGIVAEDLHMPDNVASLVIAGEWNEEAHTGSGIVISDAVKMALPGIEFSKPVTPAGAMLASYVSRYDIAETDKAGIVKQAAAVAGAASTPTQADFNGLVNKLKDAGLIVPDTWNLSVLACPTPAAMPTEETAANSGHATVTIDGTEITVALDCAVADLADANHGETWGTHKWLGFGIRTGLSSVEGVKFSDGSATVTLGSGDAAEATALGLSAGDFVLYIKAEQPEYLIGAKYFTLQISGHETTTYTMQVVEAVET